ncbi:bifunctional phosphoglucose/phosphomannose isomerase [Luteibaculum oceani]|uniref:Bifunctional phosphoglucose/phosphomannose isomerase n=1 Tax=Luteibaculum oceani TaxID=1294296 RepID=A0A5C6VJZ0_9FLAO|nr:bifunctional phosphoglucose/phosphomannose isomerase [Luteibaculum oceani]TXC85350.1 bifunctional phosphoglucose/phosphomannose isomerase [Luteibaculum oceani]
MKELVADFFNHVGEGLKIAEGIKYTGSKTFKNVVITGLGGSGIGGRIVSQWVANESQVPIYSNSNYSLPNFVGKDTLVVACSYSGNTEETLESVDEAIARGATLFCISSGGKLIDLAKAKNIDFIQIPGGLPPRAAIGYSLTQLTVLMKQVGVAQFAPFKEISSACEMLQANLDEIKATAKSCAEKIHHKQVVIYTEAMYEGVAIRLRQQLNENAKILCWHHVLPEMNHNELVGWAGGHKEIAVLNLRNEDEHKRTKERFKISGEIMGRHTDNIIDINSKGSSRVQRSLYHIHLGDWISVYLAELRKVDPIEVKVIDFLKGTLAKI